MKLKRGDRVKYSNDNSLGTVTIVLKTTDEVAVDFDDGCKGWIPTPELTKVGRVRIPR